MANKSNIERFTAAELRSRPARNESLSDLARVRAKSEAELEQDIADDPDLRDISEAWCENAVAVMPTVACAAR